MADPALFSEAELACMHVDLQTATTAILLLRQASQHARLEEAQRIIGECASQFMLPSTTLDGHVCKAFLEAIQHLRHRFFFKFKLATVVLNSWLPSAPEPSVTDILQVLQVDMRLLQQESLLAVVLMIVQDALSKSEADVSTFSFQIGLDLVSHRICVRIFR